MQMKAICIFNNKGGVGKTTLACNIASILSTTHKLRTLLIDCDPQCNSTQLILGEQKCLDIYFSDGGSNNLPTIFDVVYPLLEGDASINKSIKTLDSRSNRFCVDLMPGHPKFSLIEDVLSEAWGNVRGGDLGGIRKTNWFYSYCESLRPYYDVVVIDVGPSLGSINRSILLGADGFAAPMGSDIFSLLGVRNVSEWLRKWSIAYNKGTEALLDDINHRAMNHHIRKQSGVTKGFYGYTVQQYVAKTVNGERRATKAYEDIISRVPRDIEAALGEFAPSDMVRDNLRLGEIPNMFSLVPMAQSASSPMHNLNYADGIRGAGYSQQIDYVAQLKILAKNLAINAELISGE
jgi:cellulose biosynthesis protein BcsQ